MRAWFAALPVHRKLVALALLVTTAALLASMAGVIVLDIWRYRVSAADDVTSLAHVIAENSAAALTFEDLEAAHDTLATARVRPVVTRACLYRPDGSLFSMFERSKDRVCPVDLASIPGAGWRFFSSRLPVVYRQRTVGSVYVERDVSDLATRIALTVGAGLFTLVFATALAFAMAHRINRSVSAPIAQLAAAAHAMGPEQEYVLPPIAAGPDEIGELVRAFTAMVLRVKDTTQHLVQSNESLRSEMSERRRMEAERELLLAREREANKAKDEFLAAVSHELRTPLNAILGWVQILSSTTADPHTISKAIESIARNARAQTRVIEDLVDVSRIVTGKLNLRVECVDLRAPVEAAVEVIRPVARARHITLEATVPGEACLVSGDPDRLQQIASNLLGNAVKFTPDGGQVSISLADMDGAYPITVTDTGIGIAPDFLGKIFDRFRQADGSMSREHGGLGLGLAIVKELAELHGGDVAATSDGKGRGATFTVRIPHLAGLNAQPHGGAAATSQRPWTHPRLNGISILAVDDNADALDILCSALNSAGAQVSSAASGMEAIRAWERSPAEVLICDLAMPEMSGFEVVRRIRALDVTQGKHTAAIAVSAHASASHIEQCRIAGFDRHLAKPYETPDLVRLIAEVVTRS